MADLFSQLLDFFGLSGAPENLSEFIPWYFSVLVAVGLFLFVFGMVRSFVYGVQRAGRW